MSRQIFMKNLNIFILVSLAAFAQCSGKDLKVTPEKLTVTHVFADKEELLEAANKEAESIRDKMALVIAAIKAEKPDVILEQIHNEHGAYADLKALMTRKQVEKSLKNKDGLLYRVFWSDAPAKTATVENKSYRQFFNEAPGISIELFFYNATETEVRLEFENRPPIGILGNAVYQKYDGKWYLRRIF